MATRTDTAAGSREHANGRLRFRRTGLALGPSRRPVQSIREGDSPRQVKVREGLYRRILGLTDAVVAMLVLTVPAVALPGLQFDIRLLALVPLLIVVNKIGGLYDRDEVVVRRTTLDEVPTLFQTAGLFILLVWLARDPLLHGEIPSVAVFKLWIATFVLLVVGRLGARWLAKRLSRPERCLLIGDGSWIGSIAAKLSTPRNNVEVVGSAADVEPLELSALLDRLNVQRVVIAPHSTDAGQTLDLVRVAKAAGVRVSVVPRLFEVVGSAVEFDHVDGLTMLGVRRFGLTRSSVLLKRAFDLAGSTVLLLALAPIFVIAALSIRLESTGPVLFRQTRVGREGRRFQIIKFRTMVADAELRKSELADLNETVGLFKIANDPRVTHVGRVLRKVSLD